MTLIDKSALVAEINKRLHQLTDAAFDSMIGRILIEIRDSLDTLEVKEVDLGEDVKEALAQVYIDYTFKRHNIDPDSKEGQLIYYAYIHGINACLKELKAQKGG